MHDCISCVNFSVQLDAADTFTLFTDCI